MSRAVFIDSKKRTPAMETALAALAKLDERERIAACLEMLAAHARGCADIRYGKENKKQSHRHWHWIAHRPAPRHAWCNVEVPAADHCEARRNEHDERFLISHPYHVYLEEMREIIAFCDANNLDCTISGTSCYYPGATVELIYEDKGQQKRRHERYRAEYDRVQRPPMPAIPDPGA